MAKTQINVSNVKIDFLNIHSSFGTYDLIPHLEEFNIYENIFENHLSAHITLQDGFNIPSKLPIVGEETISCSIRLEGDEGTMIVSPPMFHVHELSDRFLKTNQSQRFSLDLVSEQYMSNIHTRVNKSYINVRPDYIVADIWSKYLEDGHGKYLNVELAKPIDCIIPGWTPHQTFNWLCERSHPEDSDHATNYVYFETIDTVHFVSLNKLVKQKPIIVFSKTHRVDDASQVEGLAQGWIKVDELTYIKQFQKVKNINRGQYASKLITHDIVKKKILQHDFDGYSEWFNINHLGGFIPVSNSETEVQTGNEVRTSYAPSSSDYGVHGIEGRRLSDYTDSDVSFYPKHNQMYSVNPEQKHDNKVETWKQRRSNQMALYDGIQMMVRCAGVSFLRVGMTATLNIPSPESTSRGEFDTAYDKYLSGTYMITAIRHIFANDKGNTSYKMLVLLTKDGLDAPATSRMPRKLGKQSVSFHNYNMIPA